MTLEAPSLAQASTKQRGFQRAGRLALGSTESASYLRKLDRDQTALATRIRSAVPGATVRWHYTVVLNGLSVVAPPSAATRIAALPGVAHVYAGVRYRRSLYQSPGVIGAPKIWGPTLATSGDGIKIGVIDDGVDESHPFLQPAGLKMPAGYPKGDRRYATAKVIVARSFPPPGADWRYAKLPFDPTESEHGTHVAGIAAGDHDVTVAGPNGPLKLSGVAPHAYIGNYRVLTIPTSDFGLDGNSPEIVAGIEQAVRDGMNVINLSLGEPEMTPSRDIVVQAIDAAAKAGVVPVIAAGNDFDVLGAGSIDVTSLQGSPLTGPLANLVPSLLGINTGRLIVFTFFVSGFLGGVAGTLVGLSVSIAGPYFGISFGLKGLAVIVLGGLGGVAALGEVVGGLADSCVLGGRGPWEAAPRQPSDAWCRRSSRAGQRPRRGSHGGRADRRRSDRRSAW